MKHFEVRVIINGFLREIYSLKAGTAEEAVKKIWKEKAKELKINPDKSIKKKKKRWVIKKESLPNKIKPIKIELEALELKNVISSTARLKNLETEMNKLYWRKNEQNI